MRHLRPLRTLFASAITLGLAATLGGCAADSAALDNTYSAPLDQWQQTVDPAGCPSGFVNAEIHVATYGAEAWLEVGASGPAGGYMTAGRDQVDLDQLVTTAASGSVVGPAEVVFYFQGAASAFVADWSGINGHISPRVTMTTTCADYDAGGFYAHVPVYDP